MDKQNPTPKLSPIQRTALRIFWGQLRHRDRKLPDPDKIEFLRRIPFFSLLKKHQLVDLSAILYERDYSQGEFLFEVGQPGAAVFMLQSGEVDVSVPSEGTEWTSLARLSKYSFVGELALLDETPRTASAMALEATRAFLLFRTDLERLLKTDPEIASHIYKALATVIAARLKATNELLEKSAPALKVA